MTYDLSRFTEAQQSSYSTALNEIKSGRKMSHWIWYIFPQIKGLGRSYNSKFYAIESLQEAKAYLEHPILGERLIEITTELLNLSETNPTAILGRPDDKKVKSCMTLFAQAVDDDNSIFKKVLDKFYKGKYDYRTLRIIDLEKD